jgi:hypothetical protein
MSSVVLRPGMGAVIVQRDSLMEPLYAPA